MDFPDTIAGSPRIFLKKNFDRGHIFKGHYIILSTSKEDFENYLPVKHLKITNQLRSDIINALSTLSKIETSEDELTEQFVGWLSEYRGINNLQHANALSNQLSNVSISSASVIFIQIDNLLAIKKYLTGYIEYYNWSQLDYYGENTREPYYSFDEYIRMKYFVKEVKLWLS